MKFPFQHAGRHAAVELAVVFLLFESHGWRGFLAFVGLYVGLALAGGLVDAGAYPGLTRKR